jgi:hypothetical protein
MQAEQDDDESGDDNRFATSCFLGDDDEAEGREGFSTSYVRGESDDENDNNFATSRFIGDDDQDAGDAYDFSTTRIKPLDDDDDDQDAAASGDYDFSTSRFNDSADNGDDDDDIQPEYMRILNKSVPPTTSTAIINGKVTDGGVAPTLPSALQKPVAMSSAARAAAASPRTRTAMRFSKKPVLAAPVLTLQEQARQVAHEIGQLRNELQQLRVSLSQCTAQWKQEYQAASTQMQAICASKHRKATPPAPPKRRGAK